MADTDLEVGDVDIVGDTVKSLLLAAEVKANNDVRGPSIIRVPNVLRDVSPNSYKPRVVSIGPLHREDENVQAMEAQKGTYLRSLLDSLELPPEETLKACVKGVNALISRIRQSYDEMIPCPDGELAQMMVMDGFFILDHVYNLYKRYSDVMLFRSIVRDLILLENQIPFFVLHHLFECTIMENEPDASLIKLVISVLEQVNIFDEWLQRGEAHFETTPNHLLGLLHECYGLKKKSDLKAFGYPVIQTAVKLDMAGVKFKPIQDPSWPMAIQFELSKSGCFFWNRGKPTVRMPVMRIRDDTESIIRNLIVYEQISFNVPTYVTSYASAIDGLVDTEEDIAILVKSGVIINHLNSKQEAANIINNICREILCMESFYGKVWWTLDDYCNGYQPKRIYPAITQLKRTYFGSPWNIIALIAGIILFALTIVQTYFTIFPLNSSH